MFLYFKTKCFIEKQMANYIVLFHLEGNTLLKEDQE